jgi:autotransporter translocation and assembly factor TamB
MIKKLTKILLFILVLLEIATVALFFVFKNEDVRIWVLEKSLPVIYKKSGYEITISNPASKSLSDWQFGEIIVKKDNHQLIEIKNLATQFNLKKLLTDHQFIINSLNIDYVEFDSSSFAQQRKVSAKTSSNQSKPPLAFQIKSFQIDVLQIKISTPSNNQKYFLAGDVAFFIKEFPLVFNLKAKNLDGIDVATEISTRAIDDDNLQINGTLTHKNGVINLDGTIQKERLDATIKINKFPIGLIAGWFGYNISGDIFSSLKISGAYLNPKIEGAFVLPIIYKKLPLKITGSGKYQNHQMAFDIESELNLKGLNIFLQNDKQKISGLVTAQLAIIGSTSQPKFSGKVTIKNAAYQNWQIGLAINNLQSIISLKGNQINIDKFSGNDKKTGKISLTGKIDLDQKLVDLNLQLEKAQIINRSDINGKASGILTLEGNFENLELYGNVVVRPLSLILDRLSTNQINTLEITEANKKQDLAVDNFMPNINLKINLKSDKQAYLIGKGLNAELKGEVKIYGDIKNPQYGGSFETIGGRYDLLGKKFILQDGKVEFQGDYFQFMIPAIYSGKDLEITAKIYGDSRDFKLDLSSIPAMSTNDIISNILFGKSSLSINPIQAIRIAKAMNDIKNPNQSSFDPIDSTRNFLKVDNLEFDSEETEAGKTVSVGVGKYVSEKVYIEFQKSNDPNQALKGNVEVEITPSLNLKSSSDSQNSGSVEVEWKRDY